MKKVTEIMNNLKSSPATTRCDKPARTISESGPQPSFQAGMVELRAEAGKQQLDLLPGELCSAELVGERRQRGKMHSAITLRQGLMHPETKRKIKPSLLLYHLSNSQRKDSLLRAALARPEPPPSNLPYYANSASVVQLTRPVGGNPPRTIDGFATKNYAVQATSPSHRCTHEVVKELCGKLEPTSDKLFSDLIESNNHFGLPYLVAYALVKGKKWVAIDGSVAAALLAEAEDIEGIVSPINEQRPGQNLDFRDLQKAQFEFFIVSSGSAAVYLGNQDCVVDLMHRASILYSLLGMNCLNMNEEEDIVRGIHIAAMRIAGHVLPTDEPSGRRLFANLMNAPAATEGLAVTAALTCVAVGCPNLLAAIVGMGVGIDDEDEEGMTIKQRIKEVRNDNLKAAMEAAVA